MGFDQQFAFTYCDGLRQIKISHDLKHLSFAYLYTKMKIKYNFIFVKTMLIKGISTCMHILRTRTYNHKGFKNSVSDENVNSPVKKENFPFLYRIFLTKRMSRTEFNGQKSKDEEAA